jgi:ubiquinone/menaquinone biosynthesis C-methylase UbiE
MGCIENPSWTAREAQVNTRRMVARDPHRFVNELDEASIDRIIARLESRARDVVFTSLFDKYAPFLSVGPEGRVLEVGCGTGATTRRLLGHGDFRGAAVGVDHSAAFIAAARSLAAKEGLDRRADFRVGDAHQLDLPDASFDAVFAHTLISHVADPRVVLREMVRVTRPGGVVAIFDGDYSSLTYAHPDPEFGRTMDVALATASFNNPRIMRDLPRLLPGLGLHMQAAWGDAVAEIGDASYFRSFAETYTPFVDKAGLLPRGMASTWLEEQHRAMDARTFFASCNYYTYVTRKQ